MYFQLPKNRTHFIVLLYFLTVLELVFFAYVSEGLYSVLYPFLIEMLCCGALILLCQFVDWSRKKNALFVFLGAGAFLFFEVLCHHYFANSREEAFYLLFRADFWKLLLWDALQWIFPIVACALLKKQGYNPVVAVFSAIGLNLIIGLIHNRSLLQTIVYAVVAALTWLLMEKSDLEKVTPKGLTLTVLIAIWVVISFLYYRISGGLLLTQESCSAFVLFVHLVCIILLALNKVSGLFVFGISALHISGAYAIDYLKNNTFSEFLFGSLLMAIPYIACLILTVFCKKREENE